MTVCFFALYSGCNFFRGSDLFPPLLLRIRFFSVFDPSKLIFLFDN